MLIHVAFHLVHKVKFNLVFKIYFSWNEKWMFSQEIIGTNISSLKKKAIESWYAISWFVTMLLRNVVFSLHFCCCCMWLGVNSTAFFLKKNYRDKLCLLMQITKMSFSLTLDDTCTIIYIFRMIYRNI